MFWIPIVYSIMHCFTRFIPKGFVISQLVFVYVWGLLPYFDVIYLGYLPYNDIPIYWVITAIIFVFTTSKEKYHR